MKEGNTTAMLEQLRLREVALNSIFAKTGQKIRVKAVKVHKNNNERVGLEVRDKELPIVLTYYPTADDMMQPDVRLIERIVDVLREERDEVGLIVHEPDRDEFTANLVPEVMSVENAKWLEADGRPCKIVLDMVVTLRCLWMVDMLADSEKIASCLVTKQVLDRYSLSESEAFSIAMQNLEESAEIVPIRQVVEELLGHEVPENDYEPDMYIVSNRLRNNGAPLMFSKKIQGELLEMFGKRSVAVLPSSIDEFIAISADHMPIEELKDMVAEINRTQVAPEARLTDEVYVITGTPEKPILGMHTSLGLPGQTFLVARY